MGEVLVADIRDKLKLIPTIRNADVELVFDPPWNQSMMSEAARLQTGNDVTAAVRRAPFGIVRAMDGAPEASRDGFTAVPKGARRTAAVNSPRATAASHCLRQRPY